MKLADFGLFEIHDKADQTHAKYVGTVGYVAPEVQKRNNTTEKQIYII